MSICLRLRYSFVS